MHLLGEQRNKGPNFEGNMGRGTKTREQYLGTGKIRKHIFDNGKRGEQPNSFQGNKGTGTIPAPPASMGGPHH